MRLPVGVHLAGLASMALADSYKLLLLVVGLGGACVAEPHPGPLMTAAAATIENTLPADGCSFPVTIDDVVYAPDAGSLVAIRERAIPYGHIMVSVEYRLTGRTGQVECGFGTHRDLPEIALVLQDD
jgi:hypothetical protein